ncbi:MAG: PssE/Cps14G family polysaccharide biosynthesis glycosyltransferase [Methanomassiliicoccales archaeon]|jgi:UDP-N-acetylglucosamine transferase subunit ALG13|nr:PssE/Cps14G family polysaccharide biosynthesis glycosyltransferase [Methanomassiliicoccales archaeon]
MIFVTVGTHNQGFERLIKKMDEIAGKIDQEVVMQIGSTDYEPKNAKWFKFIESEDDVLGYYEKADVIVAHAGAGTLLTALSLGKRVIVVPRLKKFEEHIDDQQIELAEALSREGKIIAVYDIEELERALREVKKLEPAAVERDMRLIEFLKEYIRGLEK